MACAKATICKLNNVYPKDRLQALGVARLTRFRDALKPMSFRPPRKWGEKSFLRRKCRKTLQRICGYFNRTLQANRHFEKGGQQVAWVERFCETRGLLVTDAVNPGFALAQRWGYLLKNFRQWGWVNEVNPVVAGFEVMLGVVHPCILHGLRLKSLDLECFGNGKMPGVTGKQCQVVLQRRGSDQGIGQLQTISERMCTNDRHRPCRESPVSGE